MNTKEQCCPYDEVIYAEFTKMDKTAFGYKCPNCGLMMKQETRIENIYFRKAHQPRIEGEKGKED